MLIHKKAPLNNDDKYNFVFLLRIAAFNMTLLQCFKHVVHVWMNTFCSKFSLTCFHISKFRRWDINHFHFSPCCSPSKLFLFCVNPNFLHAKIPITMVNVIVELKFMKRIKFSTKKKRVSLAFPRCHPTIIYSVII